MAEIWAKDIERAAGTDQATASGQPVHAGQADPAKVPGLAGADLHLDLSGTRIRAGLEAALRDAIQAGRLRPGTRLPSSRALSADLGIARNTIAEVYSQLVEAGFLTARTGSGTSVAERHAVDPGLSVAAYPEAAALRYDLRTGEPDLSAFPRRAWQATARKALAAAPDRLLGYPDPRGLPQLRAVVAGYLASPTGGGGPRASWAVN